MNNGIILIILLAVAAIAFFIYKYLELKREQYLRGLVTWCVSNESYRRGNRSLPEHIEDLQEKLSVADKYRISSDDEWSFVKEILEEYKSQLTKTYLNEGLKPLKSKHTVSGYDFFMITLYKFLSSHEFDSEFMQHKMHSKRLEYTHWGNYGRELYDATYSLSDFAVLYYKLIYILFLYCRNCDTATLDESVDWTDWTKGVYEKILDTRQIKVSRA